MNAYEDSNKGTLKSLQYIQRDIERLRLEKCEPDAPEEYIQESIIASEARIQPLKAKLVIAEKQKEQFIEETNPFFEKFILSLGKPAAEKSKVDSLNARDPQIVIKLDDLKQKYEKLREEQAIKDLAATHTEQQLREQLRSVTELHSA